MNWRNFTVVEVILNAAPVQSAQRFWSNFYQQSYWLCPTRCFIRNTCGLTSPELRASDSWSIWKRYRASSLNIKYHPHRREKNQIKQTNTHRGRSKLQNSFLIHDPHLSIKMFFTANFSSNPVKSFLNVGVSLQPKLFANVIL